MVQIPALLLLIYINPIPKISTVTFDYSNNVFTVEASNLIVSAAISTTLITIFGNANGSHTLANSASYSIISNTQFIITLDSNDIINIRNLLNNNGNVANDGSSYNFVVANGWNGNNSVINNASITVSNIVAHSFTLATNTINLIQNASNTIYYQLNIVDILGVDAITATFSVTTTGANIFTDNPETVVSLATNSIVTSLVLSDTTPDIAILYFTIVPDATGTSLVKIALTNILGVISNKTVTVTVSKAVNSAPIISQYITSFINDAITNTNTNKDYIYSNDGTIFAGKFYFTITEEVDDIYGIDFIDLIALQSAFSNTGQTVNNRQGAHIAIVDSEKERLFLNTLSGSDFDAFLGIASGNNSGFGTSGEDAIWTSVLGDFITFDTQPNSNIGEVIAPGRYDFTTGIFASGNGCLAYIKFLDISVFSDKICNGTNITEDSFFELPSGLPELESGNLVSIVINNITQIATLTGFDLDGNNTTLSWSGETYGNGTVTFSQIDTSDSISHTKVFYKSNVTFTSTTTVTISLIDNNSASDTLDIIVFPPIDFMLATNTVNLVANASNTIRYKLDITDISGLPNDEVSFAVTYNGDIFTANPAPIVSFSDSIVDTNEILKSTSSTATLYFTVVPNTAVGIGTITITLTDNSGNNFIKTVIVTISEAVNTIPIISQDITTFVNNAIANTVTNTYAYADDVAIFGSSLYFSVSASPTNAGANFSDFIALQSAFSNSGQTVNNRLGAHLAIIDSQEERNLLATLSGGAFDTFLGMAAADITGFGVSGENATWTTVLGDFIAFDPAPNSANNEIIAPGRYDFIGAGSFADGPAGTCLRYSIGVGITVFNDRPCVDRGSFVDDGFFELPSGLPALATANFALNQQDPVTVVATLTGFDLDGDNITWSVIDNNNGTITFSNANPQSSTSTLSVFYQPYPSFYGTTTLNITLSDGINSSSATIFIIVNPIPIINKVVFDYTTGVFSITATNLIALSAIRDIDTSLITITGEGTATSNALSFGLIASYTINITSATSLVITLQQQDLETIRNLLNKQGTSSNDDIVYNLAVADNYNGIASIADNASITVINIPTASIILATYTYDNNNIASTLTISASNLIKLAGSDIDTSKLIITGENNTAITLATYLIEIASATRFSIVLNTTDTININAILNANGNKSILGITFNLAADSSYNGDNSIADTTNTITVTSVVAPSITTSTFNYTTNQLVLFGNNFVSSSAVSLSLISIVGEGSNTLNSTNTYSLTNASSYSIATEQITITLIGADITNTRNLLNRAGLSSNNNTTYSLNTANFWHTSRAVADINNTIFVTNIPTASLVSASYDNNTNILTINASNLIKLAGNDIDTSKLVLLGDNSASFSLTSYSIELASSTQFSISISNQADLDNFNTIIDSNGNRAGDGTTYTITTLAAYNGKDSIAGITSTLIVSNIPTASIEQVVFDYTNKLLTFTGTNLIQLSILTDINSNLFTIFGEGSNTIILSTYDISVNNGVSWTIDLTEEDIDNLRTVLNKNGTQSQNNTSYQLIASPTWNGIASILATSTISVSGITVPSFTLATNTVSLTKNASNTIYHTINITNIIDIDNDIATFTINALGNDIFTSNPTPVVSFSSTTIVTTMTLSSAPTTANLYFTIIPDATGTGVINISLQDIFGNTTTQSVTVTVSPFNKAPIISQDITTFVNDVIANTVSNSYVYANDIAVFAGSLYFSVTASPTNAGANFSDFIALQPAFSNTGQTVNNRLGAHLAIIDSQEERNLLATLSDGTFDSFLGMAAADITGFGVSGENATWTTVLGDFIAFDPAPNSANNEIIAPGRYDFIGAGNFADGPAGSCFRYQNSGDFNDRPCNDRGSNGVDDGLFELPSGLPFLTLINFTLDQAAPITQIATLTGVDLDGDNLTWSATDISGNSTITFSSTTNTLASTSTIGVFYQTNSEFYGNSTITIVLQDDNNASTTLDIAITINSIPIIEIVSFDYDNNLLIVAGTNLISIVDDNDIYTASITITGEGNASYTLISNYNIETSNIEFNINLIGNDIQEVKYLLNANGSLSASSDTYIFSIDDFWNGPTSKATITNITVTNVPEQIIHNVTYDASTSLLTVSASHLIELAGNDIDTSKILITGDNGSTYSIRDYNINIDSSNTFTVIIDVTDTIFINNLLNKNGLYSDDGTPYNITFEQGYNGRNSVGINASITVSGVIELILNSSNPADNQTGVLVDSNIILVFNQNVVIEVGSISLYTGDILVEDFDTASSSIVSVNGPTVTINPSNDFSSETNYYILISPTTFDSSIGNSYEGIASSTTLNFESLDITPPSLIAIIPTNNATGVLRNSNMLLLFDEEIFINSINSINLYIKLNNSSYTIIDTTITTNGITLTINPSNTLDSEGVYYVLASSMSIMDSVGLFYSGIQSDASLTFTVEDYLPPILISSTPTDDQIGFRIDNDVTLLFNEGLVLRNDFSFELYQDNSLIAVYNNLSSNIDNSVSTTIVIDIATLSYSVDYYILAKNIRDNSGNIFIGLQDSTNLNFTTTYDPLQRIIDYINDPTNTNNIAPISDNFSDLDIDGVTFDNIFAVNSILIFNKDTINTLYNSGLATAREDTIDEIRRLVAEVLISFQPAIDKIRAYAASPTTEPTPNISDYHDAFLPEASTVNIEFLNSALALTGGYEAVDEFVELQNLVISGAKSLLIFFKYPAVLGNQIPSVSDYKNIGIHSVSINSLNISNDYVFNAYTITASNTGNGIDAIDTPIEVQAIINSTLHIATASLAHIQNYASRATTTAPSTITYYNAGIVGVDEVNINKVNADIRATGGGNNTNTIYKIQRIVSLINIAKDNSLILIQNYVTTPVSSPSPSINDYINIFISTVDSELVNGINRYLTTTKDSTVTDSIENIGFFVASVTGSVSSSLLAIRDYANNPNIASLPTLETYIKSGLINVTTTTIRAVNYDMSLTRNNNQVDTFSELQDIVNIVILNQQSSLIKIIAYAESPSTQPTPTVVDYIYASINNVDSNTIFSTNYMLTTPTIATNTSRIQTVANSASASVYTVLRKIRNYVQDINQPSPVVSDYATFTIFDVLPGQLNILNVALISAGINGVDTTQEIMEIVNVSSNLFNTSLVIIQNYAANPTDTITNPTPTTTNYGHITQGVTSNNLDLVNDAIVFAASSKTTLLTVEEIRAIVNSVINQEQDSLNIIINYANNQNNPTPSVANYNDLSILGVSEDSLDIANAGVVSTKGGSNIDSIDKIQDAVNIANTSVATIRAFSISSTTTIPSIDNYQSINVNASSNTLNAINYDISQVLNATELDSYIKILNIANNAITTSQQALYLIQNYATSTGSTTVPSTINYLYASIEGVINNEDLILANASLANNAKDQSSVDSFSKIQNIIDTAEIKITQIRTYAATITSTTPTFDDYQDIGLGIVDIDNIITINNAIKASNGGVNIDTYNEISTIIDLANTLADTNQDLIRAYASSSINPIPSLANYFDAGITGVNTTNSQSVNTVIGLASADDLSTRLKIQDLVNNAASFTINALAKIRFYATTPTLEGEPEVIDYIYAGITGVDNDNFVTTNNSIIQSGGNEALDNNSKIQTIASNANIVADTNQDDIRAYNTSPNPSLATITYHNAGIKGATNNYIANIRGVDDINIFAVNRDIASAVSLTLTNRASMQIIVSNSTMLADEAFINITSYASLSFSTTPTISNYYNLAIIGVSTFNINLVNSIIAATNTNAVDSYQKIQTIIENALIQANIALNIIQEYAASPSISASPSLITYGNAGIIGVDIDNIITTNILVVESMGYSSTDNREKIQEIAFNANIIADSNQAKIRAYSVDNAQPVPKVVDYYYAGTYKVGNNNINIINNAVYTSTSTLDNLAEIQQVIDNTLINSSLSSLLEILEDSISPNGATNSNGIFVSLEQLQSIDNIENVKDYLLNFYRQQILIETGFSNPPTIAQVQDIIDRVNNDSKNIALLEVLEDSNSLGGARNINGVSVTFEQLDIVGIASLSIYLIIDYQIAIATYTAFSNPPTIAQIQELINTINNNTLIASLVEALEDSMSPAGESNANGVSISALQIKVIISDYVIFYDSLLSSYQAGIASYTAFSNPATREQVIEIINAINNNTIGIVLTEVLEDSNSPEGADNTNGISVTFLQLQQLELDYLDELLIKQYQININGYTSFSSPTLKDEVQDIINITNSNYINALKEVLEDSNSLGGADNANSATISFTQLEEIGLQNLLASLTILYQQEIASNTLFSNPVLREEVQRLINIVNINSGELTIVSPILTSGVVSLDDDASKLLLQYNTELSFITAMVNQQTNLFERITDGNIQDNVQIFSNANLQPDANGLLQVDDNLLTREVYISVDGDNTPELLWNPNKNTIESVNIFVDSIENSSSVIDSLGLPLQNNNAINTSNKPTIRGRTRIAGHRLSLWSYSNGKFTRITNDIISGIDYTWQINFNDYIRPLSVGRNNLLFMGSISLPLATNVAGSVEVLKTVNKKQARIGDIIHYTITINNKSTAILNNVRILDVPPLGFKYLDNVLVNGKQASSSINYNTNIYIDSIYATQTKITYSMVVGSGVNYGDYKNSATAYNTDSTDNTNDDIVISNTAQVSVKIVPDSLFELSNIIGKVFNDINGNSVQDKGELGVANVKLYTSSGKLITVDKDGKYHLENIPEGRLAIRIDEKTLPVGSKFISRAVQIVDIRKAIPAQVDFAVQLPTTFKQSANKILLEVIDKELQPKLNVEHYLHFKQNITTPSIEFALWTNYPLFVDKWQLVITEDYTNKIIKTFSGGIESLFEIIYYPSELLEIGKVYKYQLLLTDNNNRESASQIKSFTVLANVDGSHEQYSDKLANEEFNNYYNWLSKVDSKDSTAYNYINPRGKNIRINTRQLALININYNNKIIPIYIYKDYIEGFNNKDEKDGIAIDMIMPAEKLSITGLGLSDKDLKDEDAYNLLLNKYKLTSNVEWYQSLKEDNNQEIIISDAELIDFINSSNENASHNEYKVTGNGLYYLKHNNINEESLSVQLVVKTKGDGYIIANETLYLKQNFNLDSQIGELQFIEPVLSYLDTNIDNNLYTYTLVLDYLYLDMELNNGYNSNYSSDGGVTWIANKSSVIKLKSLSNLLKDNDINNNFDNLFDEFIENEKKLQINR